MSTKPTQGLDWATDGGATAEPASDRKATGFRTGKKPPARWFNWLFKRTDEHLTYLRDGDFQGPHTFDDSVDIGGDASVGGVLAVGDAITSPVSVSAPVHGFGSGVVRTKLVPLRCQSNETLPGWFPEANDGHLYAAANFALAKICLDLPTTAVLTRVRAGVKPDSAGTNINFLVWKVVTNLSTGVRTATQLGATDSSAGTGFDVLSTGTISVTIDNSSTEYFAQLAVVQAPSSAHRLKFLEIQYTDHGLRSD
jgi:hypothetical protein